MHDRNPPLATPLVLQTSYTGSPTAAAVLLLIAGWSDLSSLRRRDLASAVNAAVRAAGLSPDAVLLTPAALRESLFGHAPRALGISQGRLSNIRSGLRTLLSRTGVIDVIDAPVSSTWSALLSPLSAHDQAGFVAFAQWCSQRQIDPEAVTSELLAEFGEHLTQRTLTTRPAKQLGSLRAAWNRRCGAVPGWPANRLSRAADAREYTLPLEAFAESFRADLAAFEKRMSSGALDDPFNADELDDEVSSDGSPTAWLAKPLRPATVITRLDHARWAASAVVASGVPITELTSLKSLVVPVTRAREAIRFLHDRAGKQPSASAGHVAEFLRIVAKYYARLPEKDIARIKACGAIVRMTYSGMTAKNEKAIRAAMDPARDAALLRLPETLMQAARQLDASSSGRAASLAFRAVSVALLTSLPLRLANVVGLRLDQHFHRPDPRRKSIGGLIIHGSETKTGQPITVPVAPHLSAFLEEWIARFRGFGSADGNPYLFPGHGTGHRPISPQGLRDAVKHATESVAGLRLSPHQFRHLAARRFLEAYPGHYEEVRQLLGHASLATTVRHYSGVQREASTRRFDELLQGHRKNLRRAVSGAPRAGKGPGSPPAPSGKRRGQR